MQIHHFSYKMYDMESFVYWFAEINILFVYGILSYIKPLTPPKKEANLFWQGFFLVALTNHSSF